MAVTDRVAGAKLSVQTAGALASRVRLRDVTPTDLAGRVFAGPWGYSRLSYEVHKLDVGWSRDGDQLRVLLPYQLTILAAGEQEADLKPVAEVRVHLRVDYAVDAEEEIPSVDLAHFVGITGFMHSWPYFRSEVSELTTKLRFPGLVLPVVVSGHANRHIANVIHHDVSEPDAVPEPTPSVRPPTRRATRKKSSAKRKVSKS